MPMIHSCSGLIPIDNSNDKYTLVNVGNKSVVCGRKPHERINSSPNGIIRFSAILTVSNHLTYESKQIRLDLSNAIVGQRNNRFAPKIANSSRTFCASCLSTTINSAIASTRPAPLTAVQRYFPASVPCRCTDCICNVARLSSIETECRFRSKFLLLLIV
ncbi:hypothetical protein DERP_004261 [Dermatophagoides pteronyssinus]|uniref:Uncharacterized protein n=1 Tax=Dermatophagoides pteronyssinus TaxID=6956 RepID=A0ABQ8J8N9_DERPT|nr:hypothetical protein DERP_004261 [Dermatophagoides pteronyssinus]